MEMWHGTLWILNCETFNTNKLKSTGKIINELLSSLFQVSRKNPKMLLDARSSSYISMPASLNWHAKHMKGCNPLSDSPVTQPALSPHSPGSPCHSLLGTLFLHAAGKEKSSAAFSPLFKQAHLWRGNTLAAQYSMKNYFSYFRSSKHSL